MKNKFFFIVGAISYIISIIIIGTGNNSLIGYSVFLFSIIATVLSFSNINVENKYLDESTLFKNKNIRFLFFSIIFIFLCFAIFNISLHDSFIFDNELSSGINAILSIENNFVIYPTNLIDNLVALFYKLFEVSTSSIKIAGWVLTSICFVSFYAFLKRSTNNYNIILLTILLLCCSTSFSLYNTEGAPFIGSLTCLFFSLFYLTSFIQKEDSSYLIPAGLLLGTGLLFSYFSITNYLIFIIVLLAISLTNNNQPEVNFKSFLMLLSPSIVFLPVLFLQSYTPAFNFLNKFYDNIPEYSFITTISNNISANIDSISSIFQTHTSFSLYTHNILLPFLLLFCLYGAYLGIKNFKATENSILVTYGTIGTISILTCHNNIYTGALYVIPAYTYFITLGILNLITLFKDKEIKDSIIFIFSGIILINYLYIMFYLIPFTGVLKDNSNSHRISIILDIIHKNNSKKHFKDIYIDKSLLEPLSLLHILNYQHPTRGRRKLDIKRQPFFTIDNNKLSFLIHIKRPSILILKNNYSIFFKSLYEHGKYIPLKDTFHKDFAHIYSISNRDIINSKDFLIESSSNSRGLNTIKGSLFLYSYKQLHFKFLFKDIKCTINDINIKDESTISNLEPYKLLPVNIEGKYPTSKLKNSLWVKEFKYEPFNLITTKYKFFKIDSNEHDL